MKEEKHKMRSFKYFLFVLSMFLFFACDSGDIEEKKYTVNNTGKTVKLTGCIRGLNAWEESEYGIALAGFSDDSYYAVMQRTVTPVDDSGVLNFVLNGVSNSISTVELAVTNNLRRRILSLATINMTAYGENTPSDTIYLEVGDIDVTPYGCIQMGIFDKACIQCHGGNGRSAGGLNLMKDLSYGNLVDVASTQKNGYYRVISGDADNSLLWQILNEGGENLLHYNHTEVLSSQFKNNLDETKSFIQNWIKNLAD